MIKEHFHRIILLGLMGAVVATLCDAIHIYTKTLSYPDPFYWEQAWWVFPGFTLAFIGMAVIYMLLVPWLSKVITVVQSQRAGNTQAFAETMMFFAIVYMLSGFGNESPALLCLIFYVTFLIRWLFTYDRAWLLTIAVLLGIGGVVGEGLLAEFGFVTYRQQDIFHMPYWLAGVYMHGAFALREAVRLLIYKK